jgi:Domain of unknown function (DUF5666)
MRQLIFFTFAMLLGALAAPALAQNGPPAQPVAGVVASIDGQTLTVKAADGKTVTVKLADNAVVTRNKKVDFSAIKAGDFIASAAVQQQDGKIHAQELRIFPEALRGLGEGHHPMAQPNQTMTNATVAEITGTSSGGVLHTKYPGGTTDIVVDPTTPITEIVAVDRSELKPGASISARAIPTADGTLTARAVAVQ